MAAFLLPDRHRRSWRDEPLSGCPREAAFSSPTVPEPLSEDGKYRSLPDFSIVLPENHQRGLSQKAKESYGHSHQREVPTRYPDLFLKEKSPGSRPVFQKEQCTGERTLGQGSTAHRNAVRPHIKKTVSSENLIAVQQQCHRPGQMHIDLHIRLEQSGMDLNTGILFRIIQKSIVNSGSFIDRRSA